MSEMCHSFVNFTSHPYLVEIDIYEENKRKLNYNKNFKIFTNKYLFLKKFDNRIL